MIGLMTATRFRRIRGAAGVEKLVGSNSSNSRGGGVVDGVFRPDFEGG